MLSKKKKSSAAADKGYASGYEKGLRDGACESLVRLIEPVISLTRNVSILYIPQGFEAIDQGIIEALRQLVREVHVSDSKHMAEQASLIRPDWMLVLNGLHVFPEDHLGQVDAVRALGIRTAIWFADDPYVSEETVSIAPHYDVVLTHELSTVELYRERGCQAVHYMPLAVHSKWFKPMRTEEKYRSDICFIGQGFWNRVELFDLLAPYLAGKRVFIAGGLWDRLSNYTLLKPYIRMGWLPVEESIRYYNGAKIVINLHRTTLAGSDNKNTHNLPGRSINPRTFEISACGTLQLTDVREDLSLYYQSGKELETFSSAEELRAKIDYYLGHEEERRQIALRGLRRTRREHTFITRIQQLADELQW
ncbi:spore maturation protein [Paenibacillus baekrokdamisoli]|uniref:Spore maturation protein n=1 Tax=Paenibacillus baekrokdamisoli TaxID=1712516 RepID=A0A3G9IK88_9BACL|nr:glycosyltransferase [Paenibacillus baekrokdamisoli]MBB3069334.1 spore maturation protein CgeB [Paenibacillus baekrokdamisoli]BBH18696.1 spore maturation protein [Paenibacillus baekrokdamisoli]